MMVNYDPSIIGKDLKKPRYSTTLVSQLTIEGRCLDKIAQNYLASSIGFDLSKFRNVGPGGVKRFNHTKNFINFFVT